MGKIWLYFSIFFWCGCTAPVTTPALLNADFLTAAKSNIRLLVPANNVSLNTTEGLVFVWEEKAGVGKYTFEMADSQNFSNVMISKTLSGNNYEFSSADLKSGTAINSATYYWRVKVSYVTNNLQSTAQPVSFIIGNTYYVDNTFTGTTSSGTQTNPYKTIQPAIEAAYASRSGVTSTIAEVRVSKGTYAETITLRPNVTIRGGYESGSSWSRNPQANLTIISRTDGIAVQGSSDLVSTATGTIMEGFSIQTSHTTSATWPINFNGVGAATLRNNSITMSSTAFINRAVFIQDSAGFTFDSNIIEVTLGSSAGGNTGVFQNINSTGIIRNNFIVQRGPTGGNRVPISHNTSADGTYTMDLTNNTLLQFSTTSSSWAMLDWNSSGGAQFVTGKIERNIMAVVSTVTGSSRCGQQVSVRAKASSFKNNLFADCNSGSTAGAYFAESNLAPSWGSPWTQAATVFTSLDTMLRASNSSTNSVTGCNDATSCANTISGNRGGNTIPGTPTFPGNPSLDIFTGYVSTNPKTWAMKPNGAADMDNNGSYDSTIDAGANPATAGLLSN